MKKFGISGTNESLSKRAKLMANSIGLKYSKDPEFVIAIGGHGTFYYAEKKFPEIPKLIVRNENISELKKALEKIQKNEYRIKKMSKLVVKSNGERIEAINDVVVRNKKVYHAIRFDMYAKKQFKNIISDGVIVSTPYGSSGYFYSAGGGVFKNGIGIIVNNPTHRMKPIIMNNGKIKIKINREQGEVTADSIKKIIGVNVGDKIVIKKSTKTANMIIIGGRNLFRRKN